MLAFDLLAERCFLALGARPPRTRGVAPDPMQPAREPEHLGQAVRCGAPTRSGEPCRSPAVTGKRRCRMHGGAPSSGGPKGPHNGNYRHGIPSTVDGVRVSMLPHLDCLLILSNPGNPYHGALGCVGPCQNTLVTYRQDGHSYPIKPGSSCSGAIQTTSSM